MNIIGCPLANVSGRDVSFVGTGSCCERSDSNTLGTKKWVVPARDPFDGTATTSATYGKKCCFCVYPAERMARQHSLSQFGHEQQLRANMTVSSIESEVGMASPIKRL